MYKIGTILTQPRQTRQKHQKQTLEEDVSVNEIQLENRH